jgi:flagellar L-ring protein precursor FlgH
MYRLLLITILAIVAGCATTGDEAGPPDDFYLAQTETPAPVSGSIFAAGRLQLFEDIRARSIGDILVVQLTERTDAEKSSNTSISKANSNEIENPVLAGRTRTLQNDSNLEFKLDSNHEFTGGADSAQSNSLTGTVAVTVTRILPGGNLVIAGEKWVNINRGKEFIRLRGVVRPIDVGQDNVISSTKIANAEIIYSGTGETANANTAGWLSRFFMGRVWPF